MTRLDTIANRHRTSRLRDAVFAACIALAAVVSLTSVGSVAHAANVTVAK